MSLCAPYKSPHKPQGGLNRPGDLPELALTIYTFYTQKDSEYTEAKPDSILHADADDPSKHTTTASTIQLTRQLAHTLRHTYGIGRNDPDTDNVLAVTTGHYMLQTLFFSTVAASGVYSAASPASTPPELTYLIGLVEPKLIICNADTRAVVEETTRKLKFPADRVLYLGDDAAAGGGGLDLTIVATGKQVEISPARTLDWERITDLKRLENSITCILFSSGTTGLPKGVRISHRMMVSESFLTLEPDKAYVRRERPGVQYRTLAHVPAAHIAGVQSYFINVCATCPPFAAVYISPKPFCESCTMFLPLSHVETCFFETMAKTNY